MFLVGYIGSTVVCCYVSLSGIVYSIYRGNAALNHIHPVAWQLGQRTKSPWAVCRHLALLHCHRPAIRNGSLAGVSLPGSQPMAGLDLSLLRLKARLYRR